MSDALRIQPRPTGTSAPYWEGCNAQELRIQQCQSCGAHQFYPRIMCSTCGSSALEWQNASGKGRVASFTVVRRGVSAAYTAPYIVALIDLDEGPRMMSQIVNAEPEDAALTVGAVVTVTFAAWSEEISAPVFELVRPI